jgi:hypothetical protein
VTDGFQFLLQSIALPTELSGEILGVPINFKKIVYNGQNYRAMKACMEASHFCEENSFRNVGAHSEKLMFSLHCKIKSWQIRSKHLPVDEGSGPQTWRDSSKRNGENEDGASLSRPCP